MRKLVPIISVLLLLSIPSLVKAESFERDLRAGLRNDPDVASLQSFLSDRGFYSGPITGNFFTLTKEAVKKFQEQEKILPAMGYFGPKTRVRANSLLGVALVPVVSTKVVPPPPVSRESILAQLQDLQARFKALQDKVAMEEKATTTALIFTKKAGVASTSFLADPPLGAHYPYRVMFDWDTNATSSLEEIINYSPILKVPKPSARVRLTEYFPEPHTNYAVSVEVKDANKNQAINYFTFTTPSWISVYGKETIPFPSIETNPFKIAEFKVFNGTTTDLLFTNFEVLLTEQMDSTPNRNKKVYFLLRDGATTTDPLLSKTDFTFFLTQPLLGEPHKISLSFPFDVNLKSGEEKLVSLWVENMGFVKSGTLEIKSTKIVTVNSSFKAVGSFNFLLTKEPPL